MYFEEFLEEHKPYLQYLYNFINQSKDSSLTWEEIIEKADGADNVACITVDAVKGFCSQGVMSSPQMAAIVPNIAHTLEEAAAKGIHHLIFTCDSHREDSLEFSSWPQHCLKGSSESELEDALTSLECAKNFVIIKKPSISSLVDTHLLEHLLTLDKLNTIILMGGVTDLCLYHLVAGLSFYAVSRHRRWKLIVPMNTAATFNLDCQTAQELGATPHDEELLNSVFFEHMQTLGAKIVGQIV
ncbi:MAG: cysteine hydrolase family protein [Candidatus Bruticola sp.]